MTPVAPKAKPTLRDVAVAAGVSPMTASRVLSGGQHVSPERRRRVEAAVAKLGYRRNETARALRPGQRTGLIGVIITNIDNPYYAQVMVGIEEVVGRSGRRILVGISHGNREREVELVSDFVGRQVEGLIVVPSGGPGSHLSEQARGGLPLALASRPHHDVVADTVVIDDVGGARKGVALLLAQGYERVAFVGTGPAVSTSQRRLEGYRAAHADAGVALRPELIRRDPVDAADAETVVRQLQALPEPPTAYFVSNNRLMVGALHALIPAAREHPAAPPPPVVSFDEFDLADLVDYPLMIIDHDAPALGRTAAQMLLRRLDTDEVGPPLAVTLPTTVRSPVKAQRDALPPYRPFSEPPTDDDSGAGGDPTEG